MNKIGNTEKRKLDGSIVLLTKQVGLTSFQSLVAVKKSLNTSKVGHTGTLDKFAQGLLVVCTGSLTRLAGRITAFDKTYEAVIEFGKETDSLDPEGSVVKDAPLPLFCDFEKSVKLFTNEIMQSPPSFSAIHVNGKRASDEMRAGRAVELPKRPVAVYSSEIIDVKYAEDSEHITHALVRFHVSKGTYIRCLARDIAQDCGSAAYLIGLKRTKVGSFKLEDAAGFTLLEDFTIDNCIKNKAAVFVKDENQFLSMQNEISIKKRNMTPEIAAECGFEYVTLKDSFEFDFFNGKKLRYNMFVGNISNSKPIAVFTKNSDFAGVIESESVSENVNRLKYSFVVN